MNELRRAKTLEELKKVYRKLALEFHPDRGGTDEQMAEINNAYEEMFNRLKNGSKEVAGDFMSVIDELMKFDGIEIDIVGTWIWVYGNTYGCKEDLKKLNFKWASKKKKWYLGETTNRRGSMSYEKITEIYGVEKVKSAKPQKMLVG